MNEFNPNCGRCGMLNSRGFCSLTACRYPSNVIVAEPKAIRSMMVNPQIEKPLSNADRIRAMTDEELADFIIGIIQRGGIPFLGGKPIRWLDWLKSPVEVDE